MSTGSYQEHSLIRLLDEFDQEIVESYLDKLLRIMDEIEKTGRFRNLTWIRNEEGNPIAFRTNFDTPLFLIISHPISRFSTLEKYRVYGKERKLCFDLAIVPAYLVTLDVYTLIKLWNEGAKRFFSPTAEPIPEKGQKFWHIKPSSRGAQFSSMNFLLKHQADIRPASRSIRAILRDYFRYMFWSFPKGGFSCSAHFINDKSHIQTFLKNAKSIYGFEKVYDDTMLIPTKGRYYEMEIQKIDLWGLQSQDSEYKLVPVNAVLTKDIAQDIEDFRGKFFINGVVAEFRRRGDTRFNSLTVVAEYGVNDIELQQAVIGLVVSERFKYGKSLSCVGSVLEIERDVEKVVRLLAQKVRIDHTLANGIKNAHTRFDLALSWLKPIVIVDDDDLMFCHPFVLGSLCHFGLFDRIINYERGITNVLRLLDKIPYSTIAKLRQSPEANFFRSKGMMPDLIIRVLQSSVKWIEFSKTLKRTF